MDRNLFCSTIQMIHFYLTLIMDCDRDWCSDGEVYPHWWVNNEGRLLASFSLKLLFCLHSVSIYQCSTLCLILMASRKTTVTPLLMHWSHCSLALSHWFNPHLAEIFFCFGCFLIASVMDIQLLPWLTNYTPLIQFDILTVQLHIICI